MSDLFQKPRSKLDPIKRRTILAEWTTDELNYVIGRYCGVNNEILSYKKFGFIITEEDVAEEHLERSIFGDPA